MSDAIPSGQGCSCHIYEGMARYGCSRKATVFDGGRFYCTQHSPAKAAERRKKANDKYEGKKAEWSARWGRAEKIAAGHKAALAAIRQIAAGHNDARGLAVAALAVFPDDMEAAP